MEKDGATGREPSESERGDGGKALLLYGGDIDFEPAVEVAAPARH